MSAEWGATAYALHREVVRLRHEIEQSMLALGRCLIRIRDEHLYVPLGHPTFEAYLGDPEVGISRRHAYRLIGVAQTTPQLVAAGVAEARLASVGVKKLDLLRPVLSAAETPEEIDQWVAKAETLSSSDLQLEIREVQGGADDLGHDFLERFARRLAAMADDLVASPDPAAHLDRVVEQCLQARAWWVTAFAAGTELGHVDHP